MMMVVPRLLRRIAETARVDWLIDCEVELKLSLQHRQEVRDRFTWN